MKVLQTWSFTNFFFFFFCYFFFQKVNSNWILLILTLCFSFLQCGIHMDKSISRSGWTGRSRNRGIRFGAIDHQHGAWRASLDCRHCSHSWSWYCSHQFAWWKATHASQRWFLSWPIRPYLRGLQHVIFSSSINSELCSSSAQKHLFCSETFSKLAKHRDKKKRSISSTATFL